MYCEAAKKTQAVVDYCKPRGLYVKDMFNPDDEEEISYMQVDITATLRVETKETQSVVGEADVAAEDAGQLLDAKSFALPASMPGGSSGEMWKALESGAVETEEEKKARLKKEKDDAKKKREEEKAKKLEEEKAKREEEAGKAGTGTGAEDTLHNY